MTSRMTCASVRILVGVVVACGATAVFAAEDAKPQAADLREIAPHPGTDGCAQPMGKPRRARTVSGAADLRHPRQGGGARGLPNELKGLTADVAFQAPDRLRISVTSGGQTYSVGRDRQQLWADVPHRNLALLGKAGVPRFKTYPDELDTTQLPPFSSPLPAARVAFALAAATQIAALPPRDGHSGEVGFRIAGPRRRSWATRATLWLREADPAYGPLVSQRQGHADRRWSSRTRDWKPHGRRRSGPWTPGTGRRSRRWRWRTWCASSTSRPTPCSATTCPPFPRYRLEAGRRPRGRRAIGGPRRHAGAAAQGLAGRDGPPARAAAEEGDRPDAGPDPLRRRRRAARWTAATGSSARSSRPSAGLSLTATRVPRGDGRHRRRRRALYRQEARLANFFPELFHCSGFSLFGNATVGGRMYHGRVLDYMRGVGLEQNAVVIVYQPDVGQRVGELSATPASSAPSPP